MIFLVHTGVYHFMSQNARACINYLYSVRLHMVQRVIQRLIQLLLAQRSSLLPILASQCCTCFAATHLSRQRTPFYQLSNKIQKDLKILGLYLDFLGGQDQKCEESDNSFQDSDGVVLILRSESPTEQHQGWYFKKMQYRFH